MNAYLQNIGLPSQIMVNVLFGSSGGSHHVLSGCSVMFSFYDAESHDVNNGHMTATLLWHTGTVLAFP